MRPFFVSPALPGYASAVPFDNATVHESLKTVLNCLIEAWSGHAFMSPVKILFSGSGAAQDVTSCACASLSEASYGSRWLEISVIRAPFHVTTPSARLRSALCTSRWRFTYSNGTVERITFILPFDDHCPYSWAVT